MNRRQFLLSPLGLITPPNPQAELETEINKLKEQMILVSFILQSHDLTIFIHDIQIRELFIRLSHPDFHPGWDKGGDI